MRVGSTRHRSPLDLDCILNRSQTTPLLYDLRAQFCKKRKSWWTWIESID